MSAQCGKNGFCELHPVPRYEVNSPPLNTDNQENVPLSERIRRPPNAFMIFAQEYRKRMAHQYPQESNKKISTILGNLWRTLNKCIKDGYYQKAKLAEVQHKQKYPDYVYNPQEARKRKELKAQNKFINKVIQSERGGAETLTSETITSNARHGMDMNFMFEGPSLEGAQQNKSVINSGTTMSNEVRNKILQDMGILPLQTSQARGDELEHETNQIPLQHGNPLDHSIPVSEHGAFNLMPNYRSPMRAYFMPPHYTPGAYPSPYMMSYRPKFPYQHRYYRTLQNPWEMEHMRPYPVYSRRYNYMYPRPSPALPPFSQFYGRGPYGMTRAPHTSTKTSEDNQDENQAPDGGQQEQTEQTQLNEENNSDKGKTYTTIGNPRECCQRQWTPSSRLPMNSPAPSWVPTSSGIMTTQTEAYNMPTGPPLVQSRMYPPMVPTLVDTNTSGYPYGDSCTSSPYSQPYSWNPWLEAKQKHLSSLRYHPYGYQHETYNANPFMYMPHEKLHQSSENINCETATQMYIRQQIQQESSNVINSSYCDVRKDNEQQPQLEENDLQSEDSIYDDEDSLSNSALVVDDSGDLMNNNEQPENRDKARKGSDFGSAITRAANVLNYENYTPRAQEMKPRDPIDIKTQCISADHLAQ